MQDSTTMAEIADRLRELGDDPSAEAILATQRLYLPLHEREPYAGVRVHRALAYGSHPRQRLDVFTDLVAAGPQALLLFAHGGGYVSGDRRLEEPAYYDNIGLWAVRRGVVGATMSYRLAPEVTWPAGSDDVAAAVAWLAAHAHAYGIDPDRIFLFGHSAGAAHMAAYLARGEGRRPAGAIFASGVYDMVRMETSANHRAYFGADPARYAERSSVEALAASSIPLLVSCAEYDPRKFPPQAELLLAAIRERRGRPAPSICLPGHTHFSQVFHLNARGVPSFYGSLLAAFIEQHSRVRAAN